MLRLLCFIAVIPITLSQFAHVDKGYVRGQWKSPGATMYRISGKVTVRDAHTIVYGDGTEVDLNGLCEAPDLAQQGLTEGRFFPAGKLAFEHLRKLIGGRAVTCFADREHVAGSKIRIAIGFVGETELNAEMVRSGWAISDHSAMDPLEIIARDHKRGLWRGEFVLPRRWREGERLPGEPGG